MNRPLDTWRVCGHPVNETDNRGCTCKTIDPTALQVTKALERLAQRDEQGQSAT